MSDGSTDSETMTETLNQSIYVGEVYLRDSYPEMERELKTCYSNYIQSN